MTRRPIHVLLGIFVLLLGAQLGLAINYVSSDTKEWWPLPLLVGTLVLLIVANVWQEHLNRPQKPRWTGKRPPFPGLEAFTREDAGVFFARDAEVQQLFDRLHPSLPGQAHRFVAAIGPSGAGKSSLVQAGLLPLLEQQRNRWVVVGPMVPERNPVRNLAHALAAALRARDAQAEVDIDALAAELAQKGYASLVSFVDRLREAYGARASVLLVLDQAEELLTLTGPGERDHFLELLRQALKADHKLWVAATLRSEFLTGFLQAGFADLFQSPVIVGSLSRDRLMDVIEKPADKAGMTLEHGVVDRLVQDTGTGDALPLLAYTLQSLYYKVGSGGTATLETYDALGGVAGTLARQADKVTAELRAANPDTPVVATLLKFVNLDEKTNAPTRRRVWRSSLTEQEARVADGFIEARLLSSDREGDDAIIQVAHEALLRQWAPLRRAIEGRAQDLRMRSDLERWALDWRRSEQQDSYLLRDERLKVALEWAASQERLDVELPLVHEFLERSIRSDSAALERLSASVARRALASVQQDPEQSILLALAAIEECAPTPLAHQALLAALTVSRVRAVLWHTDIVRAVAWSDDGRRLATAAQDNNARIWEVASGAERTVLRGHEGWIRDMAWSLDGRRIATASGDRTARVWDAETGRELAVLRGHDDLLHAVAWSPDGRLVATGSHDNTARVWDAETGQELAVLRGHDDWVRGVTWSPDGTQVATASCDWTARIWDTSSWQEVDVLSGHRDWIEDVSWSPDGNRIATASCDRTVRVWDAKSGDLLLELRGHEEWIQALAWFGDDRIATASRDRTARVWDAGSGEELFALRGHREWVHDIAWSPNGEFVATASYDRTARVWEAATGAGLTVFRRHDDWVRSIAWSPDDTRILTASNDHTARIWDAASGDELVVLSGHGNWVHDADWSPDGRRVVTASRDKTGRIWDATSGKVLATLRGHTNWVECVAWSVHQDRVATGSNDSTARVWDADSGELLVELRGHKDWVRDVDFSPDLRHLATASNDRTVRIWDVKTGAQLAELRGHEDWVEDLAWSPDGKRLVTASSDLTARIWDPASGAELVVLRGHEDQLQGVTWSPDGKRVATASSDQTARIWDAHDGRQLAMLCVHEQWVESVAWSHDGQRIATGSRDRTARIWSAETDLDALLALAHQRTLRELTLEERRNAMLPERPIDSR